MDDIRDLAKCLQPRDIPSSTTSLHSKWKKLNHILLTRKSELVSMLEHSENFHNKANEVSDWLGKLERVAGRVAAALYVPVQAVAVGSVMQDLIGVKSPLKELTRAGRLVAAV